MEETGLFCSLLYLTTLFKLYQLYSVKWEGLTEG